MWDILDGLNVFYALEQVRKAAPPAADRQQLKVRYTPETRLALRQQINALYERGDPSA